MRWFKSNKNIDKKIRYIPKDDITSYEVAKCLEIMIGIFNYRSIMGYDNAKKFVLQYPTNVIRHFQLE